MCEHCDRRVEEAKAEIQVLLDGELLPGMDKMGPIEDWPIQSIMGMIISRCAIVIQNTDGPFKGAPLSIIIGSVAGIAMEAEALTMLTPEEMLEALAAESARNN